ncbi:Periplasmic component of amino acid ABC-type transporter/signal transduction system [Paraburkholderia ribeironis]|uniref:Periplasmic component of amino acid ABC-type transporter/signal transduction system n=1 Tax=Paraburkholderia ribeironis TaxID=1247936 RepID=A0A1N7RKL1_9BURK|nr:transporter substrate-binding domain-containing protein [Paraburkholderia ribeironis]SIT35625.1 Periplasmic component of amino acid ABC-type transporter/signal transduction system [Paraburkholderia ribeironis]
MNKSKMLTLAAITACLLGTVAAVAHADVLDDITKAKSIRIATDLAIPPSGMMDASMKPIGSDVETAQLLAKDWGLKLEFVQTTGATRIPNLQTGKADIAISTLSVTPDRAKVIDFSRPYAVLESVIGGRKDVPVHSIDDLKGRTVCVTRGTTQDVELTKISRDKGFELARYDDDATDVTAAVSGQCDLIATSLTIVNQITKKAPDHPFEKKVVLNVFDLAIGVKKGEPQLLARLNGWIDANLKNGKLNTIYKKYHGNDLPPQMR